MKEKFKKLKYDIELNYNNWVDVLSCLEISGKIRKKENHLITKRIYNKIFNQLIKQIKEKENENN